jgi:hypothetical protein
MGKALDAVGRCLQTGRVNKPCTYCPSSAGNTVDHAPPRSFYDNPPPPNLITVPCCEECRVRDMKNDRLVRNLFVSILQVEPHRAVAAQLGAKRDKSLEDDRAMAPRMAELMVQLAVKDAHGNVVRVAPGFQMDTPMVRSFLERLCRAAIYDGHGKSYFPAKFDWFQGPAHQPGAIMPIEWMQRAEPSIKQRAVGDIFHYFITKDGDKWNVLLTFFEKLQMLGTLTETKA